MPQIIATTPPPYLSGGTGRIEGVVQDVQTGQPLEGATVLIRPCTVQTGSSIRGPFHEWTAFFRTDSNGAFHIDGLPGGRFHIEARANGYLSHRHSPLPDIFARPDRKLVFDILWLSGHSSPWDEAWNELGAAETVLRNQLPSLAEGETTRIAVMLRPGRLITGRVLASGGAPIAGASFGRVFQRVWVGQGCFEVNDVDSATSDAQGTFRLSVFPDTDLELTVKAPGFGALHRTVPNSQGEPLDLVLTAAGTVRGRVVRNDGRVAVRTRVAIFDPTDLETALIADADETGAWSIDNVPPPPFAVMAWHGYSGACWRVVHEPSSALDLLLQPLRMVRGRVETPDGRPVDGEYLSQVFPFEWEGRTVVVDRTYPLDIGGLEKTNDDGRFIVPVAPGADGKALIRFDYRSAPALVDGPGDVRLVVSEETARSHASQRKYAALHPKEPETAASAACLVPPSPKADLRPADFDKRNRIWIALLESEPPPERIALLKQLQLEISGGG